MGLYERIIQEQKNAPPPKPKPKTNRPTPLEEAQHRIHKSFEDAEKEVADLDQDYRIEYVRPAQIEPFKTISCPACKAPKGEWCGPVDGEFELWGKTHNWNFNYNKEHYMHQGRMRFFAVCEGLHLEDLKKEPYRSWPYAGRFERWAIFREGSQAGQLNKTYVKKFKLYRDYDFAAQRAEKETKDSRANGERHGMGYRYSVAPVVPRDGQWIRADLAEEKQP